MVNNEKRFDVSVATNEDAVSESVIETSIDKALATFVRRNDLSQFDNTTLVTARNLDSDRVKREPLSLFR